MLATSASVRRLIEKSVVLMRLANIYPSEGETAACEFRDPSVRKGNFLNPVFSDRLIFASVGGQRS